MFSTSPKLLSSPNFISTKNPNSQFQFPSKSCFLYSQKALIQCARKGSKRTGKSRYPSEKKKLKSIQQTQTEFDKFKGFWRLFKLGVGIDRDPGKDFIDVSLALLEEVAKVLEFPVICLVLCYHVDKVSIFHARPV